MSGPIHIRDLVYTTISMIGLEFKKDLDKQLAAGQISEEEYLVSIAGLVQASDEVRTRVLDSLSAEDRQKVVVAIAALPGPKVRM